MIKNNSENSTSDQSEENNDINSIVDQVILKNKEKLEKIKTFNIEKFSLKNKHGDTLFYIRKKQDKNTKDEEESKILSKKIISEARENLGEEPLKFEEINDEVDTLSDKDADIKNQNIDKINKEKEFEEVINEIDDILKNKKQIDEEENNKSDIKDKSIKNVKKQGFFSKKKLEKIGEKQEDDWLSSSTDNLAELKKKYNENLKISDIDSSELDEKIKEQQISIEEEGEKDKSEIKATNLVEGHLNEIKKEKIDEDLGASKIKKSFFKRKKSSDKYKDDKEKNEQGFEFDEEQTSLENKIKESQDFAGDTQQTTFSNQEPLKVNVDVIKPLDKKEIKKPPKEKKFFFKKKKVLDEKNIDTRNKETKIVKPMSKPIFRAENIPKSNTLNKDEKELLDEKIKESSRIVDLTGKGDIGESEALKLAKKHFEDKPPSKKGVSLEKKEKTGLEGLSGVSIKEKGVNHEHVFFDELESSSGGWSPQVGDKEKKKETLEPSVQGEIDENDLRTVSDIELPKEVLQTKSVKLSDLGFSEKEWEELDFYALYEPFAYVEILREKESLDKCYFLVENALSEEEEKLLEFIENTISSLDIDTLELEEKNEDEYLLERLEQITSEYNVEISEDSKNKIFYYMSKKSIGLGKIDPLMKDPNIEDISCDGADVPLFLYHRKYGSLKSNVRFMDEDELASFVHKLAQKCGKHISIAEPMLDATMPDGSRIQMTLSDEITAKGSTFTIRKFRDDPFSPPDLIEFNTMSSEMIAYMWIAVENGINTLFAGGTASGKTTALNALSLFIPRESKIVSIEETREINLPHPNWIPGIARSGFGEVVADKMVGEIDMYDLMKAALRQRPEYIIVGEIRGKEAYVLFQAMATGHATYSTVHADSAQSLIHRLEGKPINIPRIMLQSLDIVCLYVITRVKNIRARRCKQIIEIIDIDPTTKEILTNEVFRWDPVEDKFIYSGKSYILERVRAEKDLSREQMTNEIKNRKKIVEWMNENNIRAFRDVSKIVAQYTENPEETIKLTDRMLNNK